MIFKMQPTLSALGVGERIQQRALRQSRINGEGRYCTEKRFRNTTSYLVNSNELGTEKITLSEGRDKAA